MIRCGILLGIMALMPPLIAAQDLPAESNDRQLIAVRRSLAAGNLQEAEQTVRRFLSSHDDSADAHELLGYILFKQNDPKSSLAEYTSAGRLRPLGAPEFEVMGCDYFLLENYVSADEWLTRSIESGSKNALALYLLGRTKYNERHFAEAASFLRQSLALDSKSIKAQTNLGRAYEQLGRTDDALAAYRVAVALDSDSSPADPDPYIALGTLLTETNQTAQALPFLIKAAQLAPDQPQSHRQLVKAYLALQQPA